MVEVIENDRQPVQRSRRVEPLSEMIQKHRAARKRASIQTEGRQPFLPECLNELKCQDRLAGTRRPGEPRSAAVKPPRQEGLHCHAVRVTGDQGQPFLRPAVLQKFGL